MELQEKIDQYILNQLNKADKAKFEELIASDTRLQNEIALQKSISKVFNQTGSAQLKARLNQVPISMASTGNAIMFKWIGAGVAASLIAGFIIFMLPKAEQKTENIVPAAETNSHLKSNSPAAQKVEQQYTASSSVALSNSNQAKQNTQHTAVNKSKNTTAELEEYKETSDFSDVTNGDITRENQSVSLPSSNLSSENNKLNSLSVSIDDSNGSEKSYQFSGSKLTLFGDFAKHPYELLELNHKGEKALYLSYQNEFYELVWGKSAKTPLNKVNNKQTIEKLKLINH